MRTLCKNILKIHLQHVAKYSKARPKIKEDGHLIISCKKAKFDHYSSTSYDKLNEMALASKGWNHSKANGDSFTVHPVLDSYKEETYPFEKYCLDRELIKVLKNEGIDEVTEFQDRAILTIQSEQHTLLAAETGCGKTMAYLLPIIQDLAKNKTNSLNTPRAVVIVPNRELAYQVSEVATTLGEPLGVKVKVIVGGQTQKMMMNPTFEEIDLLVGTPGALGKLSTIGVFKLNEVHYTVLDEADTLIDDSFIERMNSLIKRVSQSQMILVTATLIRNFPDILAPIEPNLQHVVSRKIHRPLLNITQKFLRLNKSMKPSSLLQIVKSNKDPMLVFTNKSETCNWLALFLRENGVPCANINGDMNYAIRIDQWNQFVRGTVKILSATDVGSRGLNTIQVKHVLNYDFPIYAADYLHRVGRIGRFGSPEVCKATNFVSGPAEVRLVQQIEMAIRTNEPLQYVDGNITNIVQKKIARRMRETT